MSSEHAHVLFVGKIPKDTSDEDFQGLFPGSYRSFMVQSTFSNKFRVGYVYYTSPELATKALKSGATLPNGSSLVLKPARDKASSLSNKKEAIQASSQAEFDRKAAKAKKARIIIRNLSFKASEEHIQKAFKPFGSLQGINILTKPDGKRVGCAFVQLASVEEAAKAIKSLNGKEINGRTVALDWAVSKKYFSSNKPQDPSSESGEESEDESNEDASVDDDDMSVDGEDPPNEEGSDMEEESDEDVSESDDEDEECEPKNKALKWTPGHDIDEGRTVFIRNLSFDSTEEDLKDLMTERYGRVLFARFVMDKIKEHPKGTAFVKFDQSYSAQRAIEDKEPLALDERTIHVCLAIKKSAVDSINAQKEADKKVGKDKRNLHLAREGLVREGTRAAADVSKSDLLLRTQMQKWKTSMLKDLSTFVSPFRLCIRNIPENLNDGALRKLFKPYGALTEAKVIRDEKVGKGFAKLAFVSFKEHEMALKALRAINNNPSTFRKDRRPIVEFSIENIKALKAREKRLQKSIENNPNSKGNSSQATNGKGDDLAGKKFKNPAGKGIASKTQDDKSEELESFAGSRKNPKQKNLPSHIGPKVRSGRPKISRKDLKKGAKRKALEKKLRVVPKEAPSKVVVSSEAETQEKPKKKKDKKKKRKMNAETLQEMKEEKSFNSMVKNYKAKILGNYEPASKKKKWFSD